MDKAYLKKMASLLPDAKYQQAVSGYSSRTFERSMRYFGWADI